MPPAGGHSMTVRRSLEVAGSRGWLDEASNDERRCIHSLL
ncbi:hypothetical protein L083_2864 [Actinoplanes sp. N902-109]|nr:hypothetical protein L083_2864 [Actinoplanes sp. N902-109]